MSDLLELSLLLFCFCLVVSAAQFIVLDGVEKLYQQKLNIHELIQLLS